MATAASAWNGSHSTISATMSERSFDTRPV
jgi:hypothetical protein